MLGTQLSASGMSVMHSDGDVDVDIVSSAITVTNACLVTLFGEDTNLLILLWHFSQSLHHPMQLYSNSSKTAVDIKKSKQLLSDELTQLNRAIHTFCGCDITSRLHSIGSYTVLQKFMKKSKIPKSIEDLFISIRQRRHCKLERKFYFFC